MNLSIPKLRLEKKHIPHIISFSLLLVFIIGILWVNNAQTTINQVIHACVATADSNERAQNIQGQANTGSVRIVGSEADCRTGEYHLSWVSGADFQSQIDNLQTQISALQTQVAGIEPASYVQVVTGGNHTCWLKSNGGAFCFGYNIQGQTSIPAGQSFIQLSANADEFNTCGLKADGTAECWGALYNTGGLMSPVGSVFTKIADGNKHVCGLKADGSVECWGDNSGGQLNAPSGVTFKDIAAATSHTCGLKTDGTIVCWGSDGGGGGGVTTPPAGDNFTQVSTGQYLACGLKTDGTVVCWGSDAGTGMAPPPPGVTFSSISVGAAGLACGIKTDGYAQCWGLPSEGQTTPPSDITFTQVSAGGNHACGIATDNTIRCWGWNGYGQAPQLIL